MRIIEKPIRRDGKVPVVLIFNNGVHLHKLWTPEKLAEEKRKGVSMGVLPESATCEECARSFGPHYRGACEH